MSERVSLLSKWSPASSSSSDASASRHNSHHSLQHLLLHGSGVKASSAPPWDVLPLAEHCDLSPLQQTLVKSFRLLSSILSSKLNIGLPADSKYKRSYPLG